MAWARDVLRLESEHRRIQRARQLIDRAHREALREHRARLIIARLAQVKAQ